MGPASHLYDLGYGKRATKTRLAELIRAAEAVRWNDARWGKIWFPQTTQCDGQNADLTLTFYIRQPESGNRLVYMTFGWSYGHATIEISDGSRSVMRGFYPGPGQTVASLDREPVPGHVKDNKEEREKLKEKGYDVIFVATIESPNVSFEDVLAYMDEYDKGYDLDDNSCGHFVLDVGRYAGLPIPATFGTLNIAKDGKSKLVVTPSAMGEDFILIGGSRHDKGVGSGK